MRDAVATAYKVRENRARRVLDRMSYRLEKSPRRDPRAADFGLYRIVPAAGPRPLDDDFAMSLPEVEAWVEGSPTARSRPPAKAEPTALATKGSGRAVLRVGDCRAKLRRLPPDCFHACITSPPYYFVRSNGHAEEIGVEDSPDGYIAALVGVFRQVRRVLHPQGTLWIVIDDTYCTRRAIRADGKRGVARDMATGRNTQARWSEAAAVGRTMYSSRMTALGLKDKDLMLIPARLALALQADGWWVRSDIAWVKPNFAPSPADDRPVRSHETVLLLSKSKRYWFDSAALRERSADGRQRPGRDVWSIRPSAEKGDHTSAFPVELASKCVLAGSPPGSWVLDPFAGTGTTGLAAVQHGRNAVLVELDPGHAQTIRKRLGDRIAGSAPTGPARRRGGPTAT
jgi:site-specific DNA-methyltransferase (cytosine-N4-specific)